jgi:TolB-like protein/DNA-binding winged helix-turn-helix (wHTH) protein/Flp pilus assembly protein TadD
MLPLMDGIEPPPSKFQFGAFELDLRARELRKQGLRVKLQEQPLQLLATLLEHAGEVVTKEDLRQRIWPADTYVDFDHGLHSAVTRLRDALSDSSESPRFVETLPRRGYRFVAPVKVIGQTATSAVHEELRQAMPTPQTKGWDRKRLAGLVGGALLLVLILIFNLSGFRGAGTEIRSLAVLPLENLSGDPAQEYFADGMTDAVIADLSRISALRVISRTSSAQYKKTTKKLPEIARELNVDAVVEGSVTRWNNRVRITAQLLHARMDEHLWAETYEDDVGDVLKLQSEVARDIAQHVRAKLTTEQQARLGSAPSVNPEAYEAYVRGRYFWNQRTEAGLWKSVELFQHAIDFDPRWALPYVGVADAYLVLDSWTVEAVSVAEVAPKANAAVEKALELDPTLAEAHTVLAGLKHGNWDWAGAGAEYRRAIELNPNYAHAHQWYGQLLAELGQFDHGVSEAERAHTLDPLNLILGVDVGYRRYWARRYHEAISPIQKTLELDSGFAVGHRYLGQVYEQIGMHEAALAELRRATALTGGNPIDMGALGHAYAVSGRRTEALHILEELRRLSAKRYVSAWEFALIHTGLGERDAALHWLQEAFHDHSAWMLHLKVDPRLDPLRSDPRFQELMRRVGLA